jgi:hypothetical protein
VSYAAVLRIPGAPRAVIAATVARLSYGTLPLTLLLTVRSATGSLGAAGAADGTLGLATSTLRIPVPPPTAPPDHVVQLRSLLTALAVTLVAAALTGPFPALGALVLLAGLAVAPIYVVAFLAVDLLAGPRVRTEATTWVATAANLGSAVGAAFAGRLIERTSPGTAVLTAAAVIVLAVIALNGRAGLADEPARPDVGDIPVSKR